MEIVWYKHIYMRVSPMEYPWCSDIEMYEEKLETAPLDLSEDGVALVSPKLSGASGVLGEEAI